MSVRERVNTRLQSETQNLYKTNIHTHTHILTDTQTNKQTDTHKN